MRRSDTGKHSQCQLILQGKYHFQMCDQAIKSLCCRFFFSFLFFSFFPSTHILLSDHFFVLALLICCPVWQLLHWDLNWSPVGHLLVLRSIPGVGFEIWVVFHCYLLRDLRNNVSLDHQRQVQIRMSVKCNFTHYV